jgi:hypothetical protein
MDAQGPMTSFRLTRPAAYRLQGAGLVLLAVLFAFAAKPAASHAAVCTPPVANEIACENSKTGADPSTWQIDGAGDENLQGYGTSMSVNKGETISFKIKSTTSAYHIDILRLGWYGGDGARLIEGGLTPTGTSTQPACNTYSATGLIDCGNWAVTRSWTVPSTAVSGVYIAHLVRNDGSGSSHITFVVRDDASHSGLFLQTSDATWQAYNAYGGNSLYQCNVACPDGPQPAAYSAAYKVSYNRPLHVAEDDGGRSALFTGAEWPMIRFLERNGYDVSYTSGVDTETRPALIKNHKIFISSGHDEYWSKNQRNNVTAARDAGTNLAFFSGNEMFWKTRYEPSAAGTSTPNRTLVSYKDTHFAEQQDPVEFTGTWRDPRFTTPADGVTPENALTGQSFVVNYGTSNITVPAEYGKTRLWRNTAARTLGAGQTLALAPSTLGYEWDVDADNGYRPAGQVRLSSTTVSGLELFTDYGSTALAGGTTTHNLTMYRAPSGAKVFGAGTVQWAWGLDDDTPVGNTPDRNMQQATVNLFADMGNVQPSTLLSTLTAATASTDTVAPTATISTPTQTVADGAKITISGTATDVGGGVVAGIEVSTDNGVTWHPATTGTASWTYSWTAHGNPSTVIKARATDDSANIGVASAGLTINVSCSCSIWGTTTAPPSLDIDSADPSPVELGVKFTSDAYGTISGLRFYKAAANTGTHVGSLWNANGDRLAQATFTGESTSGWQTVTFASPVEVLPNTTYIASYYAPNGHYAATSSYFYRSPAPGPNGGAQVDSVPLHAVKNTATTSNGVYNYGSSAFPNSTYGGTNYWVDVLFTPLPKPGAVSGVAAVEGGRTSANVTWTAPSTGGPVTSYVITPFIGATAQTAKTITGTPPLTAATVTGLTTGTAYTFTVTPANPTGAGPASAKSNAVTPSVPVVPSAPFGVSARPASNTARVSWSAPSSDGDSALTGYTVTPYIGAVAQPSVSVGPSVTTTTVANLVNGTSYTFKVKATNAVGAGALSDASNAVTPQATIFDFTAPAVDDSGDTTPAELGVKFKADATGTITGIRFYKAAANTGTHVGSLWTAAGSRLAQVTFTNESASGWQTATFASPVSVTAGTTYVASYFAPGGRYSATSYGLEQGADNGGLHALADASSVNGVYAYSGTASTFPTASYRASNYWVDVLYAVPVPGQVTGVTAAASGATSADVSWTAPATGGAPTSYTITPYIGSTPQTSTTVSGAPPETSKTITGLTSNTTYTFVVRAQNANGAGTASTASNTVTPVSNVAPSAPTGIIARPATSSAQVSWSVPANDGGSPITGYTVVPYIGATAQTGIDVGPTTTTKVVTGLTNATAYTFKVKATNAVGTGAASAASSSVTPQATIYDFATPSAIDSGDTDPVAVGVKLKADADGWITGIRFYKAAANTGTHVGTLWTAAGVAKAQATFTGESASGWQSVTFSSPVAITAGTTYVASYQAPNGHYSVTGGGLASGVDNGVLHALGNGESPNGVFAYGGPTSFPNSSYNAGDYGVDVLFALSPPPGQVTGVTATAGQGSATVSWTAPSSGGSPTSYKITPYIGATAQTTKTITGTPPATSATVAGLTPGTAYTFTVQAINVAGAGAASSASAPVTPQGAVAPGAPTGVTARADTKSAVVSWTAPAADGGSAITGYTVTPYVGASAQTPIQVDASPTSALITGLTNGTSYTFTVKATTAAATGAASAASGAVAPVPSIFDFTAPPIADSGDTDAVVLGVKFKADVNGSAIGVRFYKAAANTGTHVGTLYSATGSVLGQVTFTGETASGWQSATFASPVPLTGGTTYVVSYVAPNGHYTATGGVFNDGAVDNAPLHALANETSPNGVFAYSSSPAFPTGSWNATNYWVDVLFSPAP